MPTPIVFGLIQPRTISNSTVSVVDALSVTVHQKAKALRKMKQTDKQTETQKQTDKPMLPSRVYDTF